MKQFFLINTTFLAVIAMGFFATAAKGGEECVRSGCVRVEVKDELGNRVKGAAVEMRLPGADGKLMNGADLTLTRIDGLKKGPAADGDNVDADGDVEFDLPELGQKLKPGTEIMLSVAAATQGLTGWSTTTAIPSNGPLAVSSSNSYALIISIINEREEPVSGLAVKAGNCEAVDGGEKDADGKADAEIFAMCQAVLNESAEIQVLSAIGGAELYKTITPLNPLTRTRVEAVVKTTEQNGR